MLKTLGEVAYEAAAAITECQQPWAEANQVKWESAAAAIFGALAKELPNHETWREPGLVCSECGDYVLKGWLHGCA